MSTIEEPLHRILTALRTCIDVNFFLRRKNLARVAPHLTGQLLELGVGQGPDQAFFKSLPNVSYTGCDRAEHHDTYTKSHTPASDIVYYSGKELPFPENRFDSVVSVDCLEHIVPTEIYDYMSEAKRVLKPGGKAIFTCPFFYPEHCDPYDYQRFSRFGLQSHVEEVGLEVVNVTSRSTAIETFVTLINHRWFAHTLPAFIAGEFVTPAGRGKIAQIVKTIALPITASVYLSLTLLGLLLSFTPAAKRDSSRLSLGYTVVAIKR